MYFNSYLWWKGSKAEPGIPFWQPDMTLVVLKWSRYSNLAIGKSTTEEGFDEQLEAIGEVVGVSMDLVMFMLGERN